MNVARMSVSIPSSLMRFLETYQEAHGMPTKSAVIAEALIALQQDELERAYAEASLEIDSAWDVTNLDGLGEGSRETE